MELDVSSRARPYFHRAGFDPLRMVPVHSEVPRQHPAYELLSRMDGLHIGVDDDREMLEEVCNDVAFGYTKPYGAIKEWEQLLQTRLVGIAETHHRHGMLYVDENDRFYNLSGMHDAMGYNGTGFRDAIDNLLFGRSMPMIRPTQPSMTWYGVLYTQGDTRLYNYERMDGPSDPPKSLDDRRRSSN